MTGIRLHPVDTWFFRDGTPFTAQSAPQDDVKSLFPPHPPTVVGALRAALAHANGWSGAGPWPPCIQDVLGDGPDLGGLRFSGPFLLRKKEPLFPLPQHLLGTGGREGWEPAGFLRPGAPVTCDLGDDVRLPEAATVQQDGRRPEAGVDRWLTRGGMNAVLRGERPRASEIVSSKCLWTTEPRIGLERDSVTRTAREGMLYSTLHVRPRRGVSLGMRIAGLPTSWKPPFGRLLPFGGENRLAELRKWQVGIELHAPPDSGAERGNAPAYPADWNVLLDRIVDAREVVLVALSPLDLEEELRPGKVFDDLGRVRVVSACLDRPQRIGGWDSRARRPLPLRSMPPPGSALFCEIPDPERFADAVRTGGGLARIGSRQEWGFGLVALGVWPGPFETHGGQGNDR